jgi:hypothetical protein
MRICLSMGADFGHQRAAQAMGRQNREKRGPRDISITLPAAGGTAKLPDRSPGRSVRSPSLVDDQTYEPGDAA